MGSTCTCQINAREKNSKRRKKFIDWDTLFKYQAVNYLWLARLFFSCFSIPRRGRSERMWVERFDIAVGSMLRGADFFFAYLCAPLLGDIYRPRTKSRGFPKGAQWNGPPWSGDAERACRATKGRDCEACFSLSDHHGTCFSYRGKKPLKTSKKCALFFRVIF